MRPMNRKEAAEYLGTTEENLAQHATRGTGPKYSKPTERMVRYFQEDCDAWLRGHMVEEPAGDHDRRHRAQSKAS